MRKIVVIVLLLISAVFVVFFSPFFKIKNASIENTACLEADFIKNTNIYGKNIFITSDAKIKKELISKYSCLADLQIEKKYPSTIHIKATALGQVLKIDNTSLALDQNGIALKAKPSDITPTFFLPQGAKIEEGKKTQDKIILFAAVLAANLNKSDFTAASIRVVDGDSVAVYSRQESVAIFSQKKDIASQVDSLQSILAKAKIDSSKIEKIDLRFDKPVLTLKSQP